MSEPSIPNPGTPAGLSNEPDGDPEGAAELAQHRAVMRGLIANGITAVVEYPGCVVIELDSETTVWTGLESWAYGSIYRLRDGAMCDTDDPAEPAGISENSDDVEAVVIAWTAWVRTYRAGADERS